MKNSIKDSEFSGLFWGEGYCAVIRAHVKINYTSRKTNIGKIYDYYMYRARISLGQREDNKEVIDWLLKNYGGDIYWNKSNSKKPNQHNSYQWRLTNPNDCLKVCDILLQSSIPSKKRKSVEIVKKYCEWIIKKDTSRQNTPEERMQVKRWYEDCKNNHKFSSNIVT